MDRTPTIRDIAAAVGLHNATVSRALRNDPRIPAETRNRVSEAAKRMGYRVNPVFASLMSNIRTGKAAWHAETIAYVTAPGTHVAWRKNHAFLETYEGARARAESLGLHLDLFEDAAVIESRLDRILHARAIRGVVIAMLHPERVHGPLRLPWSSLAVVQIDPHPHLPMFPGSTSDRSQVVREAFSRARSLGYRRVGLALPSFWDRLGHWISGYMGAAWNLPGKETVAPFYPDKNWNRESFARWLKKERPDVVMTSDRAFVWRWLDELNLRVPDDIAYVELDLPPDDAGIAGIRQSNRQVGSEAVSLLAGRLYHNDTGPVDRRMMLQIAGEWRDGKTAPGRRARR